MQVNYSKYFILLFILYFQLINEYKRLYNKTEIAYFKRTNIMCFLIMFK